MSCEKYRIIEINYNCFDVRKLSIVFGQLSPILILCDKLLVFSTTKLLLGGPFNLQSQKYV